MIGVRGTECVTTQCPAHISAYFGYETGFPDFLESLHNVLGYYHETVMTASFHILSSSSFIIILPSETIQPMHFHNANLKYYPNATNFIYFVTTYICFTLLESDMFEKDN
jgi:hypothetical protein